MSQQDDIRQQITSQIIEALGKGTPPWRRPWCDLENTGFPTNIVTKRAYSGINSILLDMTAPARGFQSKFWGTFRQWSGLKGKVKKRPADVPQGQWGTRIVLFKPVVKKNDDEEKAKSFLVLRQFVVFCLDQVEGEHLDHLRARPKSEGSFIDYSPADEAITATKADIRYGGNRAYYARNNDYIQIPLRETFDGPHEWYATHFHELAHWAYQPRLGLEASYAFEELVAEIGSCYLASEIGVPQSEDLTNHNANLGHWLKELKSDPKAIFRAATQASKVTDFILGFSRPHDEVEAAQEVEGVA